MSPIIFSGLVTALLAGYCAGQLQTFAEWTSVDFSYDPARREADLRSGRLKPEDVVILDSDLFIDRDGKEFLFVTTPDVLPGTPFTLSSVTGIKGSGGFLLKPFPSPSWHKTGNCNNTITSVWRMKIDKLGRLWAIDSGMEGVFTENPRRVCPPQLLVFDLHNLRVLRRFQIPEEQLKCDNLLLNLEVEVLQDDTYAYLIDPTGFRMYVYSFVRNKSFYVDHPYFYPDPNYGFYDLNGRTFTLMDGVFSASLGLPDRMGNRSLFFHSLSSGRENVISTGALRDPEESQNPRNFAQFGYVRPYHTSAEVIDDNGMMVFANLEDNSLVRWDTRTEYSNRNFFTIAQDQTRLQFVSGMKIAGRGDLLVTTSRLQNVITGNTARNQINYRVLIWRNVASASSL